MNKVTYIQCPCCKTGWYGETINKTETEYIVRGLSDTDISKPLTCLNCGATYIPTKHARVMQTEEWIAKLIMTIKM